MNRMFRTFLLLSLATAVSALADKASPALELARQLNQAFVEVAEQVSPAVVVVMVAQKPGYENIDPSESPLWEFLPPDLRKQFEDQLEERKRKGNEEKEKPQGPRQFTGEGSGVIVREEGCYRNDVYKRRHRAERAGRRSVAAAPPKELTYRRIISALSTRAIQVPASVWKLLAGLRTPKTGAADPVFRSRKGENGGVLRPLAVLRIVRKAAARAGIELPVSPHWFRHAHASHALDRGAPIHLVQATLGHASITTTGRYLHARPNDSSSRFLPL